MNQCSYCGRENESTAVACSGCGTPLTGNASEPGPSASAPAPTVVCPKCGAADDYAPAIALRSSFSVGVFLIGGLLAVLFRNASRPRRVRCRQCDAVFSIRTPASSISLVVFWLLMAPGILALGVMLLALLRSFFPN